MEQEIAVSIICNAYNHEKYIRKALDSFVNQKATFKFEVLVHDDASTDSTADIIREYEEKYPDIVKPIYQIENQYSKMLGTIGKLQAARARGKYIALCEGDDYWIDENKLQKQFDALENNRSCYFCVCGTNIVNEDETFTGKSFPKVSVEEGIIPSAEFMSIIKGYNFQTSSFFMAADQYKSYYKAPPKFREVSDIGDEPLLLYFGYIGNVYYIDEKMSCYRTNSISSWNRNVRSVKENAINHNKKMIEMYREFDKFSDYVYHDIMEERISMTRYSNAIVSENYKEILSKKNRKYYKRLHLKDRIRIRINSTVPFLYPIIYYCYKKLRKK